MSQRDPRYDPRFCEVSRKFHRDLQALVLAFVEHGSAFIPKPLVRTTAVEAMSDAIEAMHDDNVDEEESN